jgi:hypothetical protein
VCFHHSHARLRVQRAPGFPCALSSFEGDLGNSSGASRRENVSCCVLLFDN